MCGTNSKFKELKALESGQSVWKMNVKILKGPGKKENIIISIFECLDHQILINLLLHSTYQ